MTSMKLFIFTACSAAFLVGCQRFGVEAGAPPPTDGMTAAEYNWWLVAGYAWPVVTPLVRFIPVIGPILQPILANISWATLATKKQKLADEGKI